MKPFWIMSMATCLFCSCSKTLSIHKNNYNLKTFGSANDQIVELDKYKSPNSRADQEKDKLVIVCASGGGSRAAAFTIGVLLELENISLTYTSDEQTSKSNILNEIDYFSTVSGGGWGASAFISYKFQNLKYRDVYGIENPFSTFNSFEPYLLNRCDFRYTSHQITYFLESLMHLGYKSSDWVNLNRLNVGYLGWGYRESVEDSLFRLTHFTEKFNSNSVNEIVLSDIFKPINSRDDLELPMIIANSTDIDNFKLVPFTPDRLNYWGVSQYIDLLGKNQNKTPNISQDDFISNIPLASAIKASSCVPGFISTSYFKSKKDDIDYYLHLEDGGVVDNQGIYTAKAILNQNTEITKKNNRIVIIIDASGSGLQNEKKYKKFKASRFYCAKRVALNATPDAQYPLMRERIRAMENENNCKVIYIGTETLLDPNLGKKGSVTDFNEDTKTSESKFYDMYSNVLKDPNYFNNLSMNDRALLYEYIKEKIPTWFTSKKSSNKGKYITAVADAKGSAKIMFLAGRGVVQLKKDELLKAFQN